MFIIQTRFIFQPRLLKNQNFNLVNKRYRMGPAMGGTRITKAQNVLFDLKD